MSAGDFLRNALRDRTIPTAVSRRPANWLRRVVGAYNRLRGSESYLPPTDRRAFREVQKRSREPTDISDHLERLFVEGVRARPDTIVELGVREGESTFVFERVARSNDADLVSVDVEETTYTTEYDRWRFVESDDVEFAERFEEWCGEASVDPAVDVLFVDTSHRYEHTVAEIDAWFPHLADDAVVLFHDTNMGHVFRREDGTIGLSPHSHRGVVRALEEYFGCAFGETEPFVTVKNGFVVEHYPFCSGLAVLRKIEDESIEDAAA